MSTPTVIPSLPPLDEYSLVGIWMSTVLYGMNVLLYAACMYILLRRHTDSNSQWVLMLTSSTLFILATMHVGASLRQLIDSLIDAPKTGIPDASILYWADLSPTVNKVKGYAYTLIDSTQDFVLIWRLYVVWGNSWLIVVIPLLLELLHLGVGLAETAITTNRGSLPQYSALYILAWIIVVTINVVTTLGIAGRLLWLERSMSFNQTWTSGAGSSTSRYLAPIFTMIESGAIFTSSTIVLLVFYATGSPLLQTAVNIATQLAATTPLLIIVRVGFGLTHSFGSKRNPVDRFGKVNSRHPTTISAEVNIFRTVKSDADTAVDNDASLLQLDEYKPDETSSDYSSANNA